MPCERVPFGVQSLEGCLWDASSLSAVDEGGRGFVSLASSGLVTEYLAHDAEHYLVRGDSLIFRGYTRGRNIGALVDTIVPVLRFPFVEGDSVRAEFTVTGAVEGKPVFYECGAVSNAVSRRGRFVFAPGDTVPAFMVREERVYHTVTAGDAVGAAGHDIFVRWYTKGSMLPFAVQLQRQGDASPRLFMAQWDDVEVAEDEAVGQADKDALRRSVLDGASVERTPDGVTVSLGGVADTEAEVYIVDVAGNIYGRTSRKLDGDTNEFVIATSSLSPGSYMLVIILGGEAPLIEKRLIVL